MTDFPILEQIYDNHSKNKGGRHLTLLNVTPNVVVPGMLIHLNSEDSEFPARMIWFR